MKTVAYDGVAAGTTDELADALMGLAVAVAQFGSYEAVTFPVLASGQVEQLTLMLGPTIHLSILTNASTGADLDGAEEAAARIRDRAATVTDPLHNIHREVEPRP